MRKFISGVIVGAVVFSITTVMAQTWNVIPNPFPIVVDGETRDVNALNINNSTYVHFRDLAELTGLEVEFDAENEKIYINSTSETTEPVKEPADEPVKEPAKDPADEPVKEPAKDPADETGDLTLEKAKALFLETHTGATIEIAKKEGNTFYIEGVSGDQRHKMKFKLNGEVILDESFTNYR